MMSESWVDVKYSGFEKYKVSNFGRVLTPKGKILKWHIRKWKTRERPFVYLAYFDNTGKKHQKNTSVAHLVYEHFGKEKSKFERYGVFYKDKNPLNNHIDNLFVFCGERTKPTTEQERLFTKEVYKCIKAFFCKTNFKKYVKNGLDIDNITQESAIMIWKYLHLCDTSRNFYSFCAKYTRFCALKEWKKFKEILFVGEFY